MDTPFLLSPEEITLFQNVAWLNSHGEPDAMTLDLRGAEGSIGSYRGSEAARLLEKLRWWARNRGVPAFPTDRGV